MGRTPVDVYPTNVMSLGSSWIRGGKPAVKYVSQIDANKPREGREQTDGGSRRAGGRPESEGKRRREGGKQRLMPGREEGREERGARREMRM